MIDIAGEVTRHRASLGPTTNHFVGAGAAVPAGELAMVAGVSQNAAGGAGTAFDVHGTHTYAEEGSFLVTVTIHDRTDNSSAMALSLASVTPAARAARKLARLVTSGGGSGRPLAHPSKYTAYASEASSGAVRR